MPVSTQPIHKAIQFELPHFIDADAQLAELIKESSGMGQRYSLSRDSTTAYTDTHADVAFDKMYSGILDVTKNAITSTTGQAITWDENGLRLRKWNDGKTGYEPEQIWMNGNLITFTKDAWQTAEMAIGHIVDPKFATDDNPMGDLWGIVADNLVGDAMIGRQFSFYGQDPSGDNITFRFDGQGLYSYNARQYWHGQSDSFAMLDPDYGFMLGTEGNPLAVGDDGKVRPSCIDANGNIIFEDDVNKNGIHIPVGMNLYMDKNGKLYTRGEMFANNFCFIDGSGDVKTILSNVQNDLDATKKMSKFDLSDVDVIDLGGMILDGRDGSTGIRFKPGYEPVKYQFSTSISGPWHDTMQANDQFRRDSLDGGTTWGDPYKFTGTDGRDGKDGKDGVVNYNRVNEILKKTYGISTTEITGESIGSPYIYGAQIYGGQMFTNEFNVMPIDNARSTKSFNLYGGDGTKTYHALQIGHYFGDGYWVDYFSPAGGTLRFGYNAGGRHNNIEMYGNLDLSGTKITNWGENKVHAVLA